MIFVCSMGDLFHEDVKLDWIDQVMETIYKCPQHVFQILTKRPERMKNILSDPQLNLGKHLPNIWAGVSVSTQADADRDIPFLLKTLAAVRFISYEPALEDINFRPFIETDKIHWLICGAESGQGARDFDESWARSAQFQCEMFSVPFFYKQNSTEKMPILDGRVWDQLPERNHGDDR